jgi:ABC-type glycerol-3-phosphate transport system permease component
MNVSMRKQAKTIPFHLVLIVTTLVTLFPVVWIWLNSLKTNKEISQNVLALPTTLHFSNYLDAFQGSGLGRYFLNSAFVSIFTVTIVLVTGSLASYALAKMNFRGNKALVTLFFAGMSFPLSAKIGPLMTIMSQLGLLNSLWGLILIYSASAMPFSILMMRSFFRAFPSELEDSAWIDGCSRLQFFLYILIPLSKPALVTLGIFTFMEAWNDFFVALLLISRDSLRTLPLGLMAFQDQYYRNYAFSFAGIIMAALPIVIVYLLFQRQFIQGITAGSLK